MRIRICLLSNFIFILFRVSLYVPDIDKEQSDILMKVLMVFMLHEFLGVIIEWIVVEGDAPLVDADVGIEVEVGFGEIGDIVEVDHVQEESTHLGVIVWWSEAGVGFKVEDLWRGNALELSYVIQPVYSGQHLTKLL